MRTKTTIGRKLALPFAIAIGVFAMAVPASALAAPVLEVSATHNPQSDLVPQGTHAIYAITVSNTGSSATTSNVTVNISVPPGLKVAKVSHEQPLGFAAWTCSIAGDAQSADCEGPEITEFSFPLSIGPGEEACEAELFSPCRIFVAVQADEDAVIGSTPQPTIEVCGGGASSCATASDTGLEIVPLGFYLTGFDGEVLQENGDPATQAGSHPHTAATDFSFSTGINSGGFSGEGEGYSLGALRDAAAELPPGLVGNPLAAPVCTEAQLSTPGSKNNCPPASQVGVVALDLFFGGANPNLYEVGVYNMEVPFGLPAMFGFNALGNVTHVYGEVRSGDDYGVTVLAKNAPETLPIAGVDFTFWGVPADPAHNAQRCTAQFGGFEGCPSPDATSPKALVSLPTSCEGTGPNNSVETFLDVTSWQGEADSASFLSHDNTEPFPNPIGNTGCNAVDFSPTLQARPTINVADSPSGLDVDLHIPREEKCVEGPPVTCENAQAHLRDTTVTLPEGLVVNPSSANGLGGCSLSQFGFTNKEGDVIHTTPDPATCPDASKLGTVQVETPLLQAPLKGAVYLANPYANPFNSLLALYIAIDDKKTGVVVKLAGEVHADPNTGRISATFEENPQLPFEDFDLHFFGGAGGSLRTPATCGQFTTTSSMTPWSAPESGPPDTPSDTWAITQAPGGGACPTSQGARPNSPDLDAGALSPIAASYTPTVVNLRRADGSQEFSAVNLTLPPGLTGKLAGVGQCSDSALATAAQKSGNQEKASPSCPANSRIGTVDVAAGAGPAPYNAQGTAYLTGPYKGAPLGMAIVTPATAGPFDLGTVVVRVALHLDPNSGQITATSDPIPSILQGIPLDVRSARVLLDRPSFTRNGTSCDPLAFSGSLTSTLGQVAPLAERFQLGECGRLAFKPKLGIRLIGGTKRGAHPALKATLTMPEGANIAKASVALPKSEFLDQAHIGTVCTRVQFAADECPAASVYGRATATSPLVDYPLSGPAYLRSSNNKLPDLVIALKGPPSQPIEVDAVARIDSVKGGIRSTFEGVPDLPVSSFTLEMEGGRKGLLQNSTNICRGIHKATAEFDAQNGMVADLKPALKNSKCGKAKRKGAKKAKRPAQRGR